ncbi:MAG TPA: aldo/keto reductase [Acidimicrobiales bacterium]|nr:aldo/keto reductase [Acidimicrobiales bacterium]
MTSLPTNTLGRTGLTVSKLGYGAMELRGPGGRLGRDLDPAQAGTLLNQVLDAGITFIDTSPDYGRAEELIGEHVSHRRDQFFLASKCGCAVHPDGGTGGFGEHVFTRANVRAGVEQSLRRMRTDHLDVVQFHASPSRATLEENDSVGELVALRGEGKIRFIGMSGTLPNIEDHVAMGVFDVFQIPYSAVEREHEAVISKAAAAGAGTVIRGGVARGIPSAPSGTLDRLPDAFRDLFRARKDRFEQAGLDDLLDGMTRMEFMLRFTISHPDMHTTIVGTAKPAHLADNLAAATKGPLPGEVYEEAKRRLS